MTLIELRIRTETWFAGLGIPSARLDAEVLIAHALDVSRMAFITQGDRPLNDEELEACRELVRRRGKREPVAYILGTREFFSRDFAVDERVLIPRPDTEHLVDLALQWLRVGRVVGEVVAELDEPGPETSDEEEFAAFVPGVETTVEYEEPTADGTGAVAVVLEPGAQVEAARPATPPEASTHAAPEPATAPSAGVVLDYGTGSGAIAITLAAEIPGLRVLALDISRDALEVARANAETHEVAGRIGFVPSDGLERVPARFRGALRAIVANPPYVPMETVSELAPDVKEWEPHGALFAGEDALMHYRSLARDAGQWLAADGFLALEVGIDQAAPVSALLAESGWRDITVQRDLAGIPRVVAAWRRA